MKYITRVLGLFIILTSLALSQKSAIKEEKFLVYGNCGMCKDRIEKAVKIKEVKFARWDKKLKYLTLAYFSESITLDSLKKRIAAAGHDNEKYKAPDSVYQNLPKCCLYRDKSSTH